MSAPGGPLARFTDAGNRSKLPKLTSKATQRAALIKGGRGFRKYELTTLAKRKKRFQRDLRKLAAEAKR